MDRRELEFLVNFLINSDAIEGIDNDRHQVAESFILAESGVGEHGKGHAGAIMLLRNWADKGSEFQLDEGLVKLIQLLIVREQPQKGQHELPLHQQGSWRNKDILLVRQNSHGEILSRFPIGCKFQEIPDKMERLLQRANDRLTRRDKKCADEHDVRFIAGFHWEYERIHPFMDGNGRSGRALVYFMYRRLGVEPFVFDNIGKGENYYPCFVKNDPCCMEQYFIKHSSINRSSTTE